MTCPAFLLDPRIRCRKEGGHDGDHFWKAGILEKVYLKVSKAEVRWRN